MTRNHATAHVLPLSRPAASNFLAAAAALLFACSGESNVGGATPRGIVPLHGSGMLEILSLDGSEAATKLRPARWPQSTVVRADGMRAAVLSRHDGAVEEYDLTATPIRLLSSIRTPEHRGALSGIYGGDTLAVIADGSDHVAFFRPGQEPVDVSLPGANYLWDVSASTDGSRFFFTDFPGYGAIYVTDGTGALLDLFSLADDLPAEAATSASPMALALSPSGHELFVANYNTSDTERADDLMVFTVEASGRLVFEKRIVLFDRASGLGADLYNSTGMEVSPDGTQVWIAYDLPGSESTGGGVAVYDTATESVTVVAFSPEAHPAEISVDWIGGRAYLPGFDHAGNVGDDRIWVVDVRTHVVSTIDLPEGSNPSGIALY